MTILATHFSLVLGAWRLRVRIDLDEPREGDLSENAVAAGRSAERKAASHADLPAYAPWGRG